jgi:hypothetical protein
LLREVSLSSTTKKQSPQQKQSNGYEENNGTSNSAVNHTINGQTNACSTNNIDDEMEAAERRQHQFEVDLNDCLSRIHIVQMEHDGSTGWVPFLEALKHRLQQQRLQKQQYNEDDDANNSSSAASPSTMKTPILFLWDGFLSDIQEGDEANTREILQQMSRLLQQESDNLWWVLTTTTTASGSGNETTNSMATSNNSATLPSYGHYNRGVGHRVTEWIKQREERLMQQKDGYNHHNHHSYHPSMTIGRETCRVQLDRPVGSSVSKSSAYAIVAIPNNNKNNNNNNNNKRDIDGATITSTMNTPIKYSLSLEGILS